MILPILNPRCLSLTHAIRDEQGDVAATLERMSFFQVSRRGTVKTFKRKEREGQTKWAPDAISFIINAQNSSRKRMCAAY